MKILMVIPTLEGGGAERVFVNLANFFAERGLSVHFITHHTGNHNNAERLARTVKLDILSKKNVPANSIIRIVRLFVSLCWAIRKYKPQVVMTTLTEANVLGWIACSLSKKKQALILRQAGIVPPEVQRKDRNTKDRLFFFLLRRAFLSARTIIANSQDTADSIVEFSGVARTKIVVISNPVINAHQSSQEDVAAETKFEFCANTEYVLCVGRLTEVKDHKTLIRAFGLLSKVRNRTELIILGEGPLRGELETLVKVLQLGSKVHFMGYVNNPATFYQHANVFAMSSKFEGFGNVLVEALAFGVPIVCTDCLGGPREILLDGKYGTLTPVGDEIAMSKAIISALDDVNPLLREMRKERSMQFSSSKIGEQYIEALKMAISNNH